MNIFNKIDSYVLDGFQYIVDRSHKDYFGQIVSKYLFPSSFFLFMVGMFWACISSKQKYSLFYLLLVFSLALVVWGIGVYSKYIQLEEAMYNIFLGFPNPLKYIWRFSRIFNLIWFFVYLSIFHSQQSIGTALALAIFTIAEYSGSTENPPPAKIKKTEEDLANNLKPLPIQS